MWTQNLKVVYVLAYRATEYIRTQTLLAALRQCPGVELVETRNRSVGVRRYVETLAALWRITRRSNPDVYLLGFRGHEIFWPVRWMTGRRPLIFDALMSPSAALEQERKAGLAGKIIGPLAHRLEHRILRRADLVLTDTESHARFFAQQFGVSPRKIVAVPVGAIEVDAPNPASAEGDSSRMDGEFSVLFYGSMLPLHGIDVIVEAAGRVNDLPIRFDFIGGDAKQARRLRQLCREFGVTRYSHRAWVPLEDLVRIEIPRAAVCLGGPFGGTPQARRVITTKTSQALALGGAVIVGAMEDECGFLDRHNCLLVPQADAEALAAALHWAYTHRDELPSIGRRGYALYRERLSQDVITHRLCATLHDLLTGVSDGH